jgi:hypothetical protein
MTRSTLVTGTLAAGGRHGRREEAAPHMAGEELSACNQSVDLKKNDTRLVRNCKSNLALSRVCWYRSLTCLLVVCA